MPPLRRLERRAFGRKAATASTTKSQETVFVYKSYSLQRATVFMGESVDKLPFSVANILKGDLSRGVRKADQCSCNASKALTLAERLADVIMDVKNNTEGGRQKRRRIRTAFTQYQLKTLEKVFSHTHYPDVVMREQLNIWTSLPDSTIQVWFKNRRAKFRKEKRTPILHGKKDYCIKDKASPVSPAFCPANSPIFSTQGNAATTMEQGNRMLALPSISQYITLTDVCLEARVEIWNR